MALFSRSKSGKLNQIHNRAFFLATRKPFIRKNRPSVCAFIDKKRPFVDICNISGFTLIELLVTLTVASILLMVAAPSFSTFMKNQRITTQTNDLIADLNLARTAAVKRGISVTVCKSLNPESNAPSCNATPADAWTSGRLIFVDDNGDGVFDAGTDLVLRVRQEINGAATTGNLLKGAIGTGTKNRVTFANSGMLLDTYITADFGGAAQAEIKSCDNRGGGYGKSIVISTTGRTKLSPLGQDMAGNALVCP
jgi:type IV fimbrial biogenesis protein FimT